MKQLNKIRLMSGLPIDPSIEITEKKEVVTEARSVPKRKSELAAKDSKSLAKGVAGVKSAVKHIEQAIKSLDKIPATDYAGNVPRFIQELEDLLTDSDGMKAHVRSCEDGAIAYEDEEVAKRRAEDEESTIKEDDSDEVIDEAMNFYADMNKDYEKDKEKPVNVSDGSSNGEQVWDEPRSPDANKIENPEQLRTGDEQSQQDQSDGLDIEADMKIPTGIMSQLSSAIKDAEAESNKMSVSNKDAAYFYRDLAKAFQDLKNHLDKGTRYDFKLAQTFAQSLMGPMIHKLPTDVWKFLTNGGETKSLKDYMKPVKDPITGPRNTIK